MGVATPSVQPVATGTVSASGRHRPRRAWPAVWPRLTTNRDRSLAGTLRRLDDDPVLLCDCAEGAPHTCG
jgi:hypothetical protein